MSNLITKQEIQNRIFAFRGIQVMIDRDLAETYGVDTKVLNQAVKRNIARFPASFRFQLTENERTELVTNCDRFASLKHSVTLPFAFTEQGVAMISSVLKSETAIYVSIQIMEAFVEMRRLIIGNAILFNRIDTIERKQIETEHKFEQIFKALETRNPQPEFGIFFDGQIFDAYVFLSDLVKSANSSIILIDNFVDESILMNLTKRKSNVTATIYTHPISKPFKLDIQKHNAQYPYIEVKPITNIHDRFLIIDEETLYHIGASLKDLGKKWFAFSRMDSLVKEVLKKLK
ncbi:MAG: ORF6N domain-containing protein [Bacteroidota bacterium]